MDNSISKLWPGFFPRVNRGDKVENSGSGELNVSSQWGTNETCGHGIEVGNSRAGKLEAIATFRIRPWLA